MRNLPNPDELLERMVDDEESEWVHRMVVTLATRRAMHARDLTPRERDVLLGLSHGLDTDGTATVLGISMETVKRHLANARLKLRAKNTTHAVAIALRGGIIE